MQQKYDPLDGGTYAYGYDGLNRLTSANSGTGNQTLVYDGNGNILNKSDVGNYSYCITGKPHAVSAINDAANCQGAPTFAYDANGNMTAGAGRSYTWFSFNQPKQVVGNGSTVNFLYDEDHSRVQESDGTTTTYTINPRLDLGHGYQRIVTGTQSTEKVYVSIGGRSVAIISTGASATTEWLHQDHLGSVIAITDQNGLLLARSHFDAWGKRSQVAGSLIERRGYSGHEELSSLTLVNMNGRLYDPVLGRFVSVDPLIQNPLDYQNYNSYSYVLNSPLVFTDPSGFSWWTRTRGIVIRVVAAVADAYGCSGYCSAAVGGYQGYKQGGIQGGTIGAIQGYAGYQMSVNYPLTDAVSGNIIWENVAKSVVINAGFGCASATASGGNCGRGAAAGAIGTVGNAYGLAGSVVAGCASGMVAGGSCADGVADTLGAYAASNAIHYLYAYAGGWGRGTGRPYNGNSRPNGGERSLTPEESIAVLIEFTDGELKKDINVDVILIRYDQQGFLWWGTNAARASGNVIHFPVDMAGCADFTICDGGKWITWFIHEIGHVYQHQNGISPVSGRFWSLDVFNFGPDYLKKEDARRLPSAAGLNTEKNADWHKWNYYCTTMYPGAC